MDTTCANAGNSHTNDDAVRQRRAAKASVTLLEPTIVTTPWGEFEISLHSPPRVMSNDLKVVFPSTLPSENVILMPTIQRSRHDLLGMSDAVKEEKDRLLESFMSFCAAMSKLLRSCSYWTDYCDPASGLPMMADDGNVVFPETACFERLRKYKTSSAGGCRVIVHPEWSTNIYPATFFTNAPVEVILKCICELNTSK